MSLMRNWHPQDILDDTQSALLWLGLDPENPPPFDPKTEPTESVLKLSRLFKNAVRTEQLTCCGKEVVEENIVQTSAGPKIVKSERLYFKLQDLADFAKARGETPPFAG